MISRQIKKESSILEYNFLSSQEKTKQSIKNYSYPTRDTSQTLIPINQSLKNYFYYFYRKYHEENKINNNGSFFDYLVKVIVKYDKNKLEYIQELASEFDNNDYNIIKTVYNDLQKELNFLRNEYVDFNEENDNTILILKAFYRTFIDKLIKPEYSENVTDILNYFNRFNIEDKVIENIKIKEEKKSRKRIIK